MQNAQASHVHDDSGPNPNGNSAIVFSPATENIPPQELDAEQQIIGCVLLDVTTEALDVARSFLSPPSFYREAHRRIWEAILSLSEQDEPLDVLTVAAELEARGNLELAGGKPYLMACQGTVGAIAKIRSYCMRVARVATRRQMIAAGGEIIGMAYDAGMDVDDAVAQAEGMVMALARREVTQGLVHISEILPEAWHIAEQAQDTGKGMVGITTGFTELDELTCGLMPTNLVIVAGRPAMGKSAMAIGGLGYAAAKASGDPVAIFSLEMGKLEQAFRWLSLESRIDSQVIRGGNLKTAPLEEDAPDDWTALAQALTRLSDMPLYLDDQCGISTLEIRSRARRLKSEKGLAMVIVDYVQLVRSRGRGFSRHDEITQIARELKQMARELKVPVVALSQLSRQVERRDDKRPILSDLLESGSLESEADQVMLLYRPRYYDPDLTEPPDAQGKPWGEPIEVHLAKNRQGPNGIVRLNVVLKYGLFREWEDRFKDPHYTDPVGTKNGKLVYDD